MNPWIVVTGNPVDGFQHFGPFTHSEDAGSFAETELRHEEWWLAELKRPYG